MGREWRTDGSSASNVYTRAIGQPVTLDVQRGAKQLSIRVPVVERETPSTRLSDLLTPQNSIRALGVLVLDLTPEIVQVLPPLRRPKGVVVANVSSEAPYSQQGQLHAGDVIYALNGQAVATVAELKAAVDRLKPNEAVVLQIEREGGLMFIAFRAEPR